MASATFSGQLHRETHSPLQYFPLVGSPAIKSDEYAVNRTLILARTISGVALSYIAMAAIYWICPPIALLVAKYQTLAVLGLSILPFVLGMVELWRANDAADLLAAEEYRNEIPSNKATDRLCSSPRAFQYLVDRKENLNKLDSKGKCLASKIFSSLSVISNPKVQQMLVNTGLNLLEVDADGMSLFMRAVENLDSSALEYILKSKRVKATNISEQDQALLWKHVKDSHIIELLCQYGFDPNVRDAEGVTPLMHWAKEDERPSVCVAALNAGANPLLQNFQGEKASQLARANSLFHSLLLHAEREFGNEPVSSLKEKSLMARLLWKPFVRKDSFSYKFDSDALMNRVYLVGIVAIALVFFAPRSIVTRKVLQGVTAISIPLFISEWWRGEREANRQAVAEYLTSPIPSKQSTNTICRSAAAARLLIDHCSKPELLNKLDENGETLLGKNNIDPEVFKLLVDQGADIFAGIRTNGFLQACENSRPDLRAYLISRQFVSTQERPVELQLKMWGSIGSQQEGLFLKSCGFDPNVRDAEGNTPLMRIAKIPSQQGGIPLAKIHALLSSGANRYLANWEGKTAKDLAVLPRIAALLS